MPHLRNRYLEDNIKKCMAFSGLVGVLGHRQVGKTTVLEKLCKHYYTLDKRSEKEEAIQDPENYLKKRGDSWVGLDEVQTVPDLFPELKDWVRIHKKPGQFMLSGSVRFTSRDAIRESLTGRIINLELLPFTQSEMEHLPLSSFCVDAMSLQSFDGVRNWSFKTPTELRQHHQWMKRYFQSGGLPGICFIRDEKLKNQKITEQLNTLLDRDLRLVKKILLSLTDLRAIVTSLTALQGVPLDYTRIKRETGVSTQSIKKVLYALEAIFLIRTIPIEGSTRGTTIFFEDQGEHVSLSEKQPDTLEKIIHFCFVNLRAQFAYRLGESTQIFQYRTRGGAFIPFAFRNKMGCLGIVPVLSPDRVQSVLGSVNSFLKSYSNSKVLIVYPEVEKLNFVQPRVLALPLGHLI